LPRNGTGQLPKAGQGNITVVPAPLWSSEAVRGSIAAPEVPLGLVEPTSSASIIFSEAVNVVSAAALSVVLRDAIRTITAVLELS
jgi:hypothetical protein